MDEISLGVLIAIREQYFSKAKRQPDAIVIGSYEHHVDNFNEKYINTSRCNGERLEVETRSNYFLSGFGRFFLKSPLTCSSILLFGSVVG